MKICLFAYPYYNFPPDKYGPIQLIVSELAEGLVRRGHDVTTFATKSSKLKGRIISVKENGVLDDKTVPDAKIYQQLAIQKLLEHRDDFDILCSNVSFHILPFVKFLNYPVVVSLHGDYSNPHYKKVFYPHKNVASFISISKNQRKALPTLNYVGTINHGIRIEKFEFNLKPKNQLAFLGRTAPVKGLDSAIKVAKRAKMKLLIGARLDKTITAERFYQNVIKPQIDGKNIVWLGEQDEIQKVKLLRNSRALIFPVRWEEPFGLAMIEAMACGTPVIAFNRGSVPEIVQDGKTGFICPSEDIRAMVQAVKKINQMPEAEYQKMRRACREYVEKNFTVDKMVNAYEAVFKKIIENNKKIS